jgi:spermidine synthase
MVGFLSGAIMLALEVVWFRFLLLSHHGTSLIFAVMLAVVLAGIALGGLVAARLYGIDERSHMWLRHVTALSGAFVVLTYYGFDLFTVHQIQRDTTISESVAFAMFLMFPVSLLSGVAFTMVGRAVKDELGTSIKTAGVATFCNTLGAMLGPLCGGFILLPLFGMERSFFILAASYGLTALVVPGEDPAATRLVSMSARASVTSLLVCLLFFPFGLMERSYFWMVKANLPEHTLIETREGLTETAFYYSHDLFGQPLYHRLMINGFSMSATSVEARRYMKLFVYLPLAFKSDAHDALLISFGVGSTAKALTDTDGLRHIDIVDISRDILEMSSIVYADDENPLHDERVRVRVEDGRFFLNAPGRQYDLITSEPPPPKIAGVVNLYSQEYFELIRRHLTRGGYASYWLPAHQLEPLDTLSVIRAFCNAFPDCSLWSGSGMDWILLGSNDAEPNTSIQQFSAQWSDPTVNQELVALGFETPAQLGSLFMGDAGLLTELTANVAPVTDNYPLRISARHAYGQGRVPLYDDLMNETERLTRFRRSPFIQKFWPAGLKEESETFFRYERMIKNHFTSDLYRDRSDPYRWQAIDELLTHTSLETLPLWLLGSDDDVQNTIDAWPRNGEHGTEAELELAVKKLSARDYPAARGHIEAHMQGRRNVSTAVYNLYLYILAKNGMLAEARMHIARLDANGRERPDVQRFLNWFVTRFELYAREDGAGMTVPVFSNEPRRRVR